MNAPGGWELLLLAIFLLIAAGVFFAVRAAIRSTSRR
jgi:hypothetical protein